MADGCFSDSADFPDLGESAETLGLDAREGTSDARFAVGKDGVRAIAATGDGKVEFVGFERHTLALVTSSLGYPAYYPVPALGEPAPIKAMLMDLDGTTVHSEQFWIWIIEQSTASLLDDAKFELEDADVAHVSGHSVSEHLQYCIAKYCPDKSLEEARRYYFEHTDREMAAILDGKGRPGAFTPAPGIKEFLLELKAMGVKLGLVTSGLFEKAYPEILDVFKTLGMGNPEDFYDSIITAGTAVGRGKAGTMGELPPKPHPWLYAESLTIGLGMKFEERNATLGIEDSGAGICSLRLAGIRSVGLNDGNIDDSGTGGLCQFRIDSFEEILAEIKALH
ncbi:HAD family hydrolase [Haloferula chungangensis]|uniref:HAD family hydrolase n=1 Tax=Haloferula chungangensis TaxID=1048331 RepID=A0ABW2L6E5_9BACT